METSEAREQESPVTPKSKDHYSTGELRLSRPNCDPP